MVSLPRDITDIGFITEARECRHIDDFFFKMTTSGASSDESFVKIATFSFQRQVLFIQLCQYPQNVPEDIFTTDI